MTGNLNVKRHILLHLLGNLITFFVRRSQELGEKRVSAGAKKKSTEISVIRQLF